MTARKARGYWKLKGQAHRTVCCRSRSGRAKYLSFRQTTEWTGDFKHTSSDNARVLWDQGSEENICILREEVAGVWRKLYAVEFTDVYSSQIITKQKNKSGT
jgi:hypothetical protein